MKFRSALILLLPLAFSVSPVAQAATICTAIANAASGTVVLQEGNCVDRVTPASTFKIALSLMGYDAGYLKDQHAPRLPYKQGYVDWGGDAWRQEDRKSTRLNSSHWE